jgi:hypothetical protein
MTEEKLEGWVKIYETYDYMNLSLIEGRLNDEGIETQVMNKGDIGYTMEVGNSAMGRQAVNMPYKIFVKPDDVAKAKEISSEDWSAIMDNPDLNFSDESINDDEEDDDI